MQSRLHTFTFDIRGNCHIKENVSNANARRNRHSLERPILRLTNERLFEIFFYLRNADLQSTP
jgi:hypothetical protein